MAYATLIAIISVDGTSAVDDSRLLWGGDIRELADGSASMQYFSVPSPPFPAPSVKVVP